MVGLAPVYEERGDTDQAIVWLNGAVDAGERTTGALGPGQYSKLAPFIGGQGKRGNTLVHRGALAELQAQVDRWTI